MTIRQVLQHYEKLQLDSVLSYALLQQYEPLPLSLQLILEPPAKSFRQPHFLKTEYLFLDYKCAVFQPVLLSNQHNVLSHAARFLP